jgi:hypothetical protein
MQALVFEADLRLAAGSSDLARDLLDSACELLDLRPLFEGNAYCLEVVAAYAADRGDATAAARLLGLASALRDALGARIWALREPRSTSIDALVRSASDPGEFDAAFAEGRALDPRSGATLCPAALLVGTTSTDAGW